MRWPAQRASAPGGPPKASSTSCSAAAAASARTSAPALELADDGRARGRAQARARAAPRPRARRTGARCRPRAPRSCGTRSRHSVDQRGVEPRRWRSMSTLGRGASPSSAARRRAASGGRARASRRPPARPPAGSGGERAVDVAAVRRSSTGPAADHGIRVVASSTSPQLLLGRACPVNVSRLRRCRRPPPRRCSATGLVIVRSWPARVRGSRRRGRGRSARRARGGRRAAGPG